MKAILCFAIVLACSSLLRADTLLAEKGRACAVIVVDPAAAAPEKQAADELARTLQ